MKKKFFIFSILISLILVVGCSKDIENEFSKKFIEVKIDDYKPLYKYEIVSIKSGYACDLIYVRNATCNYNYNIHAFKHPDDQNTKFNDFEEVETYFSKYFNTSAFESTEWISRVVLSWDCIKYFKKFLDKYGSYMFPSDFRQNTNDDFVPYFIFIITVNNKYYFTVLKQE